MIPVRILQQVFLFSSMYITLYFWGESVFVDFNKVLFYIVVSTCTLQPVIDSLWKNKVNFETPLYVLLTVGLTAVVLLFFLNMYTAVLIILYVTLKNIERIFYVSSCVCGSVLESQIKIAQVYLIELLFVLATAFLLNSLNLEDRLLGSILAYFVMFFIFRKLKLRFSYTLLNMSNFLSGYRNSMGVLYYFVLSSFLIGIDRLVIERYFDSDSRSTAYLFYLSIYFALFGLLSIYFDKVRKEVIEGVKVKYINLILFGLCAFVVVTALIGITNKFLPDFYSFFKINHFNFLDILSISLLVFSCFTLMLLSTVCIQLENIKTPVIAFVFLFFTKLSMAEFMGLTLANLIASFFAIFISFLFVVYYIPTLRGSNEN